MKDTMSLYLQTFFLTQEGKYFTNIKLNIFVESLIMKQEIEFVSKV